jgi:hypothetical protein
MNTVKEWLWNNRTKIGYSIGGLNVLNGIINLAIGNFGLALLWLVVGGFIIYDVKTYQ